MNVASLELCKELYELSGWKCEDGFYWIETKNVEDGVYFGEEGEWVILKRNLISYLKPDSDSYPAYDLGYLLRKLPNMVKDDDGAIVVTDDQSGGMPFGLVHCEDGRWQADYQGYVHGLADTPEDAAAKLAIELHRQGVLTNEHSTSQQASTKPHSQVGE